MANLKAFFEQVLQMTFVPGGYQDSKHESAVEEILIANGFAKSTVDKISMEVRDAAVTGEGDINGLNDNEFIPQPTGKNDSPDFIVKYNNTLYFIECKSISNGYFPIYNGGLPKEEYIYIFTSGKVNATTIFYGKDIVSDQKRELYERLKTELNIILKLYQDSTEWKDDSRGFDFYIRNMYIQSGGKHKTNYFTHKERVICEQNVLNSIG